MVASKIFLQYYMLLASEARDYLIRNNGDQLNSITSPDKITYKKVNVYYRNVSVIGKVGPIRAQITSDVEVPPPAKVEKESKKMEEGVIVNKYKPKNPYTGRCLLNTKITGDDALGETNHMVFAHDRMLICAGLRGSTQFNGDFQSNNPNNKFL